MDQPPTNQLFCTYTGTEARDEDRVVVHREEAMTPAAAHHDHPLHMSEHLATNNQHRSFPITQLYCLAQVGQAITKNERKEQGLSRVRTWGL